MPNLIVADDHTVVREALCEMLKARGGHCIVAQASDGAQLLQVLNNQKADLVIMDLEMPNVDGIEALREMHKNGVNAAPVLVLSANGSAKQVRSALSAGAKGYVPKNAGIDELQFAIASIIQGKTYLSPSVTDELMKASIEGGKGDSPLSVLSKREVEILSHLADGKPNREIGKLLHISTRTVDTHRSNILKKLKVRTNAELVKIAIAQGLIAV